MRWLCNWRIGILAVIAAVLAIISVEWLIYQFAPLVVDEPFAEFVITPGMSAQSLAILLKNRGLLRDPISFMWMVRLQGAQKHIHTGEYRIMRGDSAADIVDKIVRGQVILHPFTIIEGWSFKQLAQALAANTILIHQLQNQTPAQVMQQLGETVASPEGQFFGDTYLFALGDTDLKILTIAHKKMLALLSLLWPTRDDNLPYQDRYQALIVASLIEKETALNSERPIIAGVIIRRLARNMYLQIDPTVIYALQDRYQGKLTKADMKVDSPYNTYTHKGLPPTPIAIPSEASLYAALHPDNSDALYFVAKGDGSHEFSASLAEHDAAIKKYLKSPELKTPEFKELGKPHE